MTKLTFQHINRIKHHLTISVTRIFENLSYQIDWLTNISKIDIYGNRLTIIIFYYKPKRNLQSKALKIISKRDNHLNKRLSTRLLLNNDQSKTSLSLDFLKTFLSTLTSSLHILFPNLINSTKNTVQLKVEIIKLSSPVLNDEILAQYLSNQTLNQSFNRLCLKYFKYMNQYLNNVKDLNNYMTWSSNKINEKKDIRTVNHSIQTGNKAIELLIQSSQQMERKNLFINTLGVNKNINASSNNKLSLNFGDDTFNFDNAYVASIPKGVHLTLKGRIPRDKVKPIQTVKSNLYYLPKFDTYLDKNVNTSILINMYHLSKSSVTNTTTKGSVTKFNPQLGSHTLWARIIR